MRRGKNNLYNISDPQWSSFLNLLDYVLKNSRFYKKKYGLYGIGSTKDINNKDKYFHLPLTDRNELSKNQNIFPPYGNNACLDTNKYLILRSSSGTTAKPFLMPISKRDFLNTSNIGVKAFRQLGIRRGDKVLDLHPPGSHLNVFQALVNLKATDIPWQMQTPFQIIHMIKATKATILITSTSMMLHIIDIAEKEKVDLKNHKLRFLVIGSEIVSPHAKNRIEKAFGVPCKSFYASLEFNITAYSCSYRKSPMLYHHISSSSIFEVIDPKTHRNTYMGELVLTNLNRFDYPLIRYRTGDMVKVIPNNCTHHKFDYSFEVLGRIDKKIRFLARYIDPQDIQLHLQSHNEIRDFRIELKKDFISEYMLIKLSINNPLQYKKIAKKIREGFFEKWGFIPAIEVLPSFIFQFTPWKAKRFVDLRSDDHVKHNINTFQTITSRLALSLYYRIIRRYTEEKK
jgi:phenylacetate-CoA ligase